MPSSMQPETQWPPSELTYVENELEKEYPYISFAVICMVVSLAKALVFPSEGRVKLLATARKTLTR